MTTPSIPALAQPEQPEIKNIMLFKSLNEQLKDKKADAQENVTLAEVFSKITSGELETATAAVRAAVARKAGKAEKDSLKANLPQACFHVSKNGRRNIESFQSSQYIVIDFDKLDLIGRYESLKIALKKRADTAELYTQGSRMKTRVDFQKVNIRRAYILSF
jgi:hypothetical protein